MCLAPGDLVPWWNNLALTNGKEAEGKRAVPAFIETGGEGGGCPVDPKTKLLVVFYNGSGRSGTHRNSAADQRLGPTEDLPEYNTK